MTPDDVVAMASTAGDSPVFEHPRDHGLAAEDVTITTTDGVKLSGWLIRGTGSKVIVQTHFGGISSKSGYTPDGKGPSPAWPTPIQYLRQIKPLVDHGYTVLAYDLRNHGDSAPDPSGKLTNGVRESEDVLAAVRYVTERPEFEDAPIGLLSLCMGSNATTYAFGKKDGLATIPNVRALIAVQPLSAVDQLNAMGVPEDLIGPASDLNEKQGGVDLRSSFLPAVSDIRVPTMLVQNSNDPMLHRGSIDAYFDQLSGDKKMVWLDLTPARLAAYDHFTNHPEDMIRFFDENV